MVETGMVANSYRASLARVLPSARRAAAEAQDVFRAARQAMEAGAWDGGRSREFYAGCVDQDARAGAAADACVGDLEARHRSEPVLVDAADRRAWAYREVGR